MYNTRLVLIYQRPFFLHLLTASKKTSRCDMLKIWKNSYRLSIYVIACPVGFLSLGNGMQKGCKKDFDKNQYTKKFVFQCHTVTHGIDLRKSPLWSFVCLCTERAQTYECPNPKLYNFSVSSWKMQSFGSVLKKIGHNFWKIYFFI